MFPLLQNKALPIFLVVGIIVYVALFNQTSIYIPYAFSLAVVLLLPRRVNLQLTAADKVVFLFLGFVVIRCICHIHTAPIKSYNIIYSYTLLYAIYFIVIYYSQEKVSESLLYKYLQITTLIFIVWCIINFFLLKYESIICGFDSIYHLRYLNRPWGYINNGYTLIAVSLFTMSYATRRITHKSLLLLTICVLISFSKGAIVAYSLFIISLWVAHRLHYTHILTVFAVMILFSLLYKADCTSFVKDTLCYTNSDSYEWRTTNLMSTRQFWESIFGCGIGTYSFCKETYDAETFTNTAPNIISMIWTEQGLVGCVIFLCLIISIILSGRKTRNFGFIISYVIFVIVKECAQGIMFSYFNIIAVFIITIGLLLHTGTQHRTKTIVIPKPLVLCTVSVGIVIVLIKSSYQFYIEKLPLDQKLSFISCHNPNDLYPVIISSVSTASTNRSLTNESLKNNPYVCLLNANSYYIEGDTIDAIKLLHSAILYMPSLLQSNFLNEMLEGDSVTKESLRTKFIRGGHPQTSKPKDIAKYGYILLYYNISEGKHFLCQAIEKNPSLSTPWLLLGDYQKYSFLNYSGHSESDLSKYPFQEYDLYEYLCNYYAVKVKAWYGFDL